MIEIVMAPDQNDPWQTPLLANGSLLCILTWTNTHTHTNWRITSAQIQGLYWHWLIEAPHGVASPPQFVHFHSRIITKLVDYYVSSVATAMLSIPKWIETVIRFDHVTCNIYETLQKLAAIFTHDHCMQPQKPMLLPNTGWNHISVVALGKLECKMKHLPFFWKTLDNDYLYTNWFSWKKDASSSSCCSRLSAPTGFELLLPWCLSALAMSFSGTGTTSCCLHVSWAFKWLMRALDGSSWVNTCPIASARRWADGCTFIVPSN